MTMKTTHKKPIALNPKDLEVSVHSYLDRATIKHLPTGVSVEHPLTPNGKINYEFMLPILEGLVKYKLENEVSTK